MRIDEWRITSFLKFKIDQSDKTLLLRTVRGLSMTLGSTSRGTFRIKRVLTPCTLEQEIPITIRGRSVPVFHSSDLIAYETRVLDPAWMLPEDAGEDRTEGGDEDASG